MEFLIITGLSGAGKTRAADICEDLGYYCVDNLPAALLGRFAALCLATRGRYERVALVMDVRSLGSFEELEAALGELEALENIDPTDAAALTELARQLLPLAAYGLAILALCVAGLVLFCVRFRRSSFDPAPQELPRRGRLRAVWLNPGMIAFTAVCLASIVLMFVI